MDERNRILCSCENREHISNGEKILSFFMFFLFRISVLNLALQLFPSDLFYPQGDSLTMKVIFDSNISLALKICLFDHS